jgi:hypothetical protein
MMMLRKKPYMIREVIVAFAFFFAAAASQRVLADDLTSAKRADIRALLQISGGGNLSQQFGNLATGDIIQRLRGQPGFTPKISQAIQDEMIAIFKEGMGPAGALSDKIEEVYGKYYTHQEIKGLLAFFRSPIGRKFAGASPNLSRELLAAGLSWGNSISPTVNTRLQSRLRKEGFDMLASNTNQGKLLPSQAVPALTK